MQTMPSGYERDAKPSRARMKRFNLNVTPAELRLFARAAKRAGLTMASFVRQVVLAEAQRILGKGGGGS